MSYILDALRRAQAERGLGSVPGLHTPATPMAGEPAPAEAPARGTGGVRAALAVAVLVLGAGLLAGGWWLWRLQSRPAVVVQAAPAAVAPVAVAIPAPAPPVAPPALAPAAEPLAVAPPATPPPPAAAPRPPVPKVAAPAREPAGERAQERPQERVQERPRQRPDARKPPPEQGERRAPDAPARAAAPPQSAPVFAKADLPPAVREQLPTLQLQGVTYSANPLHRMAIVNGQVLHEGDSAGPGLQLERIEPGRTVWAFRGYRYALPSQ